MRYLPGKQGGIHPCSACPYGAPSGLAVVSKLLFSINIAIPSWPLNFRSGVIQFTHMEIIKTLFLGAGLKGIMISSVNVVLLIVFLPQIWLLYKNKSAKDLSISSLWLSIYVQAVTLYYFGIREHNTPYIMVSLFSLTPLTITTIQALYYRYWYSKR